ncbi:putative aminoglycoside phosphotransferase [Pseudovibrio axinellae]|uniref:Putative aminoglycoside phosphotransferase n=1 Tax=Pseudovibrio axinellae TaxID=989403 RepID=A0A165XZ58_9HYPH|nr:phosphotransferase [Pseudovibrio axinellae]KZL18261.1 putative aminoglycoside phosphotransferase [Pseudovibrio axinellae]SER72415.1 Predicted kinase, aminoglycoside phosphotransferase (APT) family [Pseudovibrio axinellae]
MTDALHTLDKPTLQAYLQQHIEGFGEILEIEKFPGGQSNPTYKLVTTGKTYVLRAKPPGTLLKSAHMVDREYRVMGALAESDVPVPEVYHLSENDSPIGTMFFIMEYVDGRIFWDPALPKSTNDERMAIFGEMNRVLAALHSVSPNAIGLMDYGKPGNYFARQTGRWIKQYKASETASIPSMNKLMAWLEANMVADDGDSSLVHGDFRLDNLIFHPTEPRIIAVLDWELSTLGHPLADLAYQCMQWRLPSFKGLRGLAGLDRVELGIPLEEEYVRQYCMRRGLQEIENWEFYLAFSMFRLAAIIQGVVARAEAGNASNPKAADLMRQAVPLIATMACDVVGELVE